MSAAQTADRRRDVFDVLRERMLNAPGPFFANVRVAAETLPLVFPHSFDGAAAIDRFRAASSR